MDVIKYINTLTSSLMTYQHIEESLKQCLFRVHEIIDMRTNEYIPYEIPLDSIDNSALGSLIEQYKRFTKDKELITNLRQLQKHRNECAHRGYLLKRTCLSRASHLRFVASVRYDFGLGFGGFKSASLLARRYAIKTISHLPILRH